MHLAVNSILAAFALSIVGGEAWAKVESRSCTGIPVLIDQIFTCQENAIAVKKAEECKQRVLQNWKRSSQLLSGQMEKISTINSSSQNNYLLELSADLRASLKTLVSEIDSMSENRNLVQSYSSILIKYFPGITNPADPQCYARASKKIFQVVEALSEEIKNAKALREKAQGFLQVTQGHSKNLNGNRPTLPTQSIHSDNGKPRIPTTPQSSARGKSDISGTTEAIEKDRKAKSFVGP